MAQGELSLYSHSPEYIATILYLKPIFNRLLSLGLKDVGVIKDTTKTLSQIEQTVVTISTSTEFMFTLRNNRMCFMESYILLRDALMTAALIWCQHLEI